MNKIIFHFSLITCYVAASYLMAILLILIGVKKPIIIYPISFFLAYIAYFNYRENFKDKIETHKKTILILGIMFLLITLTLAIGPSLLISINN